MATQQGELTYVSDGATEICGLYVIARTDQVVEIAFTDFSVKCETGGIVAVSKFSFHVLRFHVALFFPSV